MKVRGKEGTSYVVTKIPQLWALVRIISFGQSVSNVVFWVLISVLVRTVGTVLNQSKLAPLHIRRQYSAKHLNGVIELQPVQVCGAQDSRPPRRWTSCLRRDGLTAADNLVFLFGPRSRRSEAKGAINHGCDAKT